MNRRKFIRNSSALVFPAMLNGFSLKAFAGGSLFHSLLQSAEDNDRVLVLIQLVGGNDGLNTLVPIDVYSKYYNARPNIAIDEKKVLPLSGISIAGLHPSLSGFRDLYNDGKMTILQSVGYPEPDYCHFRSVDIWLSGSDSKQHLNTGWAGRLLNNQYPDYPAGYPNSTNPHPLAIQIGSSTSFAFQGNKVPMSVNIADTSNTFNLSNGFTDELPDGYTGKALYFLRNVIDQTKAYSEIVKKIADPVKEQAPYPDNNPLANQLKIVARLIKGGMRTKIYMVSMDGYDHHAGQITPGATDTGSHAELLKTLGEAVKAFQADLKFLGIEDQVMGMTLSEFGRRIISNDSYGTDHGAAAPLFVFGKKLKGSLIGENPLIPDHVTNDDNLQMKIDFRTVYSTMLENWLGIPHQQVKGLFSKEFTPLPIFK